MRLKERQGNCPRRREPPSPRLRRLWPRRPQMPWRGDLGLSSKRPDSCRLRVCGGATHRVWLTTALSSWPDAVGPCLSLNLENCSAGSEVPAVTTPVNCVSISSPEDCQTPRGTSRDPNIYPPFPEPEEARERESFSAASQRLRWGKTHQPGHGLTRRLGFPAHVVRAQPLNV